MPTREEKKKCTLFGLCPWGFCFSEVWEEAQPLYLTASQAALLDPKGWQAGTESCPRSTETWGRLWYGKPTKYPNRVLFFLLTVLKRAFHPQSCRQWWTTHPGWASRDTWLSGLAVITHVQVQARDEQMVGGLLHVKFLKVLAENTVHSLFTT